MQRSLVPSTAWSRLNPSMAAQPEPGLRLLQAAYETSRKYVQRVRCRTLPPRLAMLRICWLAASVNDLAKIGQPRPIGGCWAASAMRTSAPRCSPAGVASMRPSAPSPRPLMSTTVCGRITSSFMRSRSVVPPARYCAGLASAEEPRAAATARTAAAGVAGRSNANGCMPRLLSLSGSGRGGRHGALRLLYRRDDVRIGGAATEVSAHVFAYVAVIAGIALVDAGDRRQDLPRRAVAALEGVLVDEGLLHGMQPAVRLGEGLDGRDWPPLRRRRQRQAGKHAAVAEQHRAGAALPVIAALLHPREAEVLAQRIEQRGARIERDPLVVPIDVERHGDGRTRIGGRGARALGCGARERRRRHGRGADHEELASAGTGAGNTVIAGRHEYPPRGVEEGHCRSGSTDDVTGSSAQRRLGTSIGGDALADRDVLRLRVTRTPCKRCKRRRERRGLRPKWEAGRKPIGLPPAMRPW